MFEAIMRIFTDVIAILTQQPRPRPSDRDHWRQYEETGAEDRHRYR